MVLSAKTSRTCIICGEAANSGEHIFPAALGGRRVNRGIYCGRHNNGFSRLAAALAEQLEMVNALLGVRPDHSDHPRTLNVKSPSGEPLVISAGSVTRADASQRNSSERMQLRLTLGGPDGLPAVGYVALTFFAHYFRAEARQSGMDPLKAFIQGQAENDFVWWESDATTRSLPENPFAFGHTVILMTSEATGIATALLSLFQCLTFGVHLGTVEGARDRTTTVFIDPHADHPPADIQEAKDETLNRQLVKPKPMHAHLQRLVLEGHGQDLLQNLFARIEEWHFAREMNASLVRLNAAAEWPIPRRVDEIRKVVEEQHARVYRLMRYVTTDFTERYSSKAGFEPIVATLQALTQLNDQGDGLSEDAEIPFALAVAAMIRTLNARLSEGPLTMNDLWLLFSGGEGAAIVGKEMLDPIKLLLESKI